MNFIALGVIAEIDDIYANSLYNNPIKNQLDDPNTEPLRIKEDKAPLVFKQWYYPASLLHK